jgi:LAS superfamily LD-carboxypeptidase LdcB
MTPRARELFAAWHEAQGQGIKAARPMLVFAQCVLLAKERCSSAGQDVRRIILKAEDITKCEERALSSARVAKFGALPRTEEAWHEQIAKVRAEMYGTPQQPVSEDAA